MNPRQLDEAGLCYIHALPSRTPSSKVDLAEPRLDPTFRFYLCVDVFSLRSPSEFQDFQNFLSRKSHQVGLYRSAIKNSKFFPVFRQVHLLGVQPQQVRAGSRLRLHRRDAGQVPVPALQRLQHGCGRNSAQEETLSEAAGWPLLLGLRRPRSSPRLHREGHRASPRKGFALLIQANAARYGVHLIKKESAVVRCQQHRYGRVTVFSPFASFSIWIPTQLKFFENLTRDGPRHLFPTLFL